MDSRGVDMNFEGRVWKYGDDVNTDVLIPARYLNTSEPSELAKHALEDLDASFVEEMQPGDIIVAGTNFGCGSSREHAPIAIKASGVSCVVAASFARIFFRNSINLGLPILESPEAVESAEKGDVLRVDLAIGATGEPLPAETLELCRSSDAVLLGAVGGPKWDNPAATVRPEQGLLGLRQALGLFANLRPVRPLAALVDTSPLRPEIVDGVDLLVVRELTGGLYFGKPSKRWATRRGRRAVDTLPYREEEIARVVRLACELAGTRRGLVSSVDKANVLETSRLWREVANEVAAGYPAVRLEHVLVDACAMHLISNPRRFDVIVTENLFGDILTDEAAVLAGSLGVLPSASLNRKPPARPDSPAQQFGLYEPIHGSAPDIAG